MSKSLIVLSVLHERTCTESAGSSFVNRACRMPPKSASFTRSHLQIHIIVIWRALVRRKYHSLEGKNVISVCSVTFCRMGRSNPTHARAAHMSVDQPAKCCTMDWNKTACGHIFFSTMRLFFTQSCHSMCGGHPSAIFNWLFVYLL